MTIKQKADAYEKAKQEANYWRAMAQSVESMTAGRQGNPALMAAGAQAYEKLKSLDPGQFSIEYEKQKKECIAGLVAIRKWIQDLETQINAL